VNFVILQLKTQRHVCIMVRSTIQSNMERCNWNKRAYHYTVFPGHFLTIFYPFWEFGCFLLAYI